MEFLLSIVGTVAAHVITRWMDARRLARGGHWN